MIAVEELEQVGFLAEAERSHLTTLAGLLTPFSALEGQVLLAQGTRGDAFLVLLDGYVSVTRRDSEGLHDVARASPGSVLGELALLRGSARNATATAAGPVRGARGGRDAFAALLDVPGVRERIARTVAGRLASTVSPEPFLLRDATPMLLRPGMPGDRPYLVAALDRMSPESKRLRFFTPVAPNDALISYLVDVNYLDHFVWVALAVDEPGSPPVASARYIREAERPDRAEIGIGIIDEYQGKGLGRVLLGALGVAASTAGLRRLSANVLTENKAMRRLLVEVGARFRREEPGVVWTSVSSARVRGLVEEPLAARLAGVTREIVTAAALALTR